MFDKIFEVLAPHTCCGCGDLGSLLCEHCIDDIVSEPYDLCVSCFAPTTVDNLCRACQEKMPWEALWVVGERKNVLKDLINLYKFERAIAGDEILAALLSRRIPNLPAETVVTYVPATASHIRQRGYDLMERTARKLAKTKNFSFAKLLERTDDKVQRGADRKIRLTQQYEALTAITTNITSPLLLIDDIYTTGGTVLGATKRLKEIYDQPVYCAVIARQPLDDLSDL